MNTLQRAVFFAGIATVAFAGPANAFSFFREPVQKPAAQDFGYGPRESANGTYTVFLRPNEVLHLRKPHALRILVLDAAGLPVEGARITVHAGMPEHDHELPTLLKVEDSLGGGMYDIEGLLFSMGGWWQVRLAIESPRGPDRVTLNLSL